MSTLIVRVSSVTTAMLLVFWAFHPRTLWRGILGSKSSLCRCRSRLPGLSRFHCWSLVSSSHSGSPSIGSSQDSSLRGRYLGSWWGRSWYPWKDCCKRGWFLGGPVLPPWPRLNCPLAGRGTPLPLWVMGPSRLPYLTGFGLSCGVGLLLVSW